MVLRSGLAVVAQTHRVLAVLDGLGGRGCKDRSAPRQRRVP